LFGREKKLKKFLSKNEKENKVLHIPKKILKEKVKIL